MAPKDRKPTIIDVAHEAGVSVGSASNVMNNVPVVSERLREKVLAAAERLQYTANPLAQTLRGKKSGIVAFCTTTVNTIYLRSLADALDAVATANGYELVQILTQGDAQQELHRIRNQIAHQVDGLFLLPGLAPERSLGLIASTRTPAVILDRYVDDDRFSCVAFNNRAAMQGIAKEMFSNGHRQILFIAQNLSIITTRHRIEGLKLEAQKAGVAAEELSVIQMDSDPAAFTLKLARYLTGPNKVTAIITGNSKVAVATVAGLQAMNIRWPRDLSLATFDDPEWADLLPDPISSVSNDIEIMVNLAWEALANQMIKFDCPRETHWIQSNILMRNSIGPSKRVQ